MYCCLTLHTVINHKPAGHLSQWAGRPFSAGSPSSLLIPLASTVISPQKKKFFFLLRICQWPGFHAAPALPFGAGPAERGGTSVDAELGSVEDRGQMRKACKSPPVSVKMCPSMTSSFQTTVIH